MATRAATSTATVAYRGLTRLFSTFPFTPPLSPQQTPARPPLAEPSTNLFVSGLNKRTTTTESLRKTFEAYGEVVHARVVTDRVSGFSKGFGFVRYVTIQEAAAAIKAMDGQFLDGWVIFVEYARPRPQPGGENPPQGVSSPFGGSHCYGQQ